MQHVAPGSLGLSRPHVRELPGPISLRELWPWAVFGFALLALIYFVGMDQGATSVVPGMYVHEFVHDGRHLLGRARAERLGVAELERPLDQRAPRLIVLQRRRWRRHVRRVGPQRRQLPVQRQRHASRRRGDAHPRVCRQCPPSGDRQRRRPPSRRGAHRPTRPRPASGTRSTRTRTVSPARSWSTRSRSTRAWSTRACSTRI